MKSLLWLPLLLLAAAGYAQASPLSLGECLELARKNNPTLRSAALEPTIAGRNVEQARAGHRPRVDFSAGYEAYAEPQAISFNGKYLPMQEGNFPFYDLSLRQTLYDFGRTASRVDRASSGRKAAGFEYDGRRQDIFLATIIAYYGILELEKLIQAAREEEAQMADHLRVASSLYQHGVVTRNDVLQAEVQLASGRQRLLSRENDLATAWLEMNYFTGRPPQERGELEEGADFDILPAAQDALQAIGKRPKLQSQRMRIEASRAEVKESRTGFLPELFVHGSVAYSRNEHLKEQTLLSGGIGIQVNLFDGFATSSGLSRALDRAAQNRRRLADLEQQAMMEYRAAVNDAGVSAARIQVTGEAVGQAEENLRLNRDRYLAQVGTATDVIDAQTLMTRAQTEHYRALFDHMVSRARIRRARGAL